MASHSCFRIGSCGFWQSNEFDVHPKEKSWWKLVLMGSSRLRFGGEQEIFIERRHVLPFGLLSISSSNTLVGDTSEVE